MKATRRSLTNAKVERIPASGIRRFFDLVSGAEGVISLGVGEPDFITLALLGPQAGPAGTLILAEQALTPHPSPS